MILILLFFETFELLLFELLLLLFELLLLLFELLLLLLELLILLFEPLLLILGMRERLEEELDIKIVELGMF